MPPRRRGLRDAKAARPPNPYLPDGTLDPREWEFACSAANVLMLVVLRDEPWFVCARPVEVFEQGVELEVVVRWLSSEVWKKVPSSVDGYVVNVILEGQTEELHTIHSRSTPFADPVPPVRQSHGGRSARSRDPQ